MPKNGKHRFTLAEDKRAKEIAKYYEKKRHYSKKRALAAGYSTVNKMRNR